MPVPGSFERTRSTSVVQHRIWPSRAFWTPAVATVLDARNRDRPGSRIHDDSQFEARRGKFCIGVVHSTGAVGSASASASAARATAAPAALALPDRLDACVGACGFSSRSHSSSLAGSGDGDLQPGAHGCAQLSLLGQADASPLRHPVRGCNDRGSFLLLPSLQRLHGKPVARSGTMPPAHSPRI